MDESTYPSTPFSAAQAQQLQFQQQLQLQTQPMESHLGPAASSLMQVHRGDSGAGMSMTNTLLQPMTDGFESTASMQQQNVGSSAVVTPVDQEPAMPQLYKTNKMRRPELWQFIRLVVPDPPHIAAGKTYTNQDAKQAYCMKCKRSMHYNTGSSNNVSRHMAKFHAADLASYAQKLADQKMRNKKQQAKSGNATAERSCLITGWIKHISETFSLQVKKHREELGVDNISMVKMVVCMEI
ncbi:hypothetical protein PHYBOEH_009299 [Phytophthora boehmeriae]|uniref:BED-type domain-containing protein n=1 Tax=Phytophthora boehmeriae TaxID=109152 RepID=A0A8T1X6T7_9STRA|nr:hypothetical protein PHYBOEH_009299 [Phytophthora boehmeriae]